MRKTMIENKPLPEFEEVWKPVRTGEFLAIHHLVVHSYAPKTNFNFRATLNDCVSQRALWTSVGLPGPHTEADSVSCFWHPLWRGPNGLPFGAMLNQFRELRLKHSNDHRSVLQPLSRNAK